MQKEEYLEHVRNTIEDSLAMLYPHAEGIISETNFISALNYTLLAGGKRIRPTLSIIFAELSALRTHKHFAIENILPAALSVELIHTYSLIHDDLPAMDNDDLRRGKPTCHKKFDEATAILVGDALLTDAFDLCSRASFPPENIVRALRFLSTCAGSKGMIAGQVLDLAMEEKAQNRIESNDVRNLAEMNARKTGDMLLAACCVPATLYHVDEEFYAQCKHFATNFGLAFQISDDVLDIIGDTKEMGKPQGSDKKAQKTTWVSLLGLEKAKEEVYAHVQQAEKIIENWKETLPETVALDALSSIVRSLLTRTK